MKQYIDGIGCALPPSAMFTFSRLRDLTLIMVKSVTDEFAASDFRIVAQEMRISESAENALCPIEIRVTEEQDSPVVVLGGTIDRVDCYDNGEKQFLRVVDYKTGTHAFDVARVADGQDLQLPAYLFTAALEENKKYFGSDKPLVPASALFLSATESSGEVSTKRSGFILKDEELLRAASSSMDKQILAGITVKDGVISGGAAVSEEGIAEMDRILRSSIRDCAKSIFDGDAKRTPSKTACKFCFLRDSCPVAVISKY
jgi:ATP-dependent helicase/nuclease subunit B